MFVLVSKANSQGITDSAYVLILDIQEHFTKSVLDESHAQQLIQNINQITDPFESNHVVYVTSVLRTLSVSLKGFQVDTLPDLALDDRLKISSAHVFQKTRANAFSEKEISEFFRLQDANEIIVVGLMAEHCVLESLLGGLEQGYTMFTIPEAIAAKSEKSKTRILKKLAKKGVILLPL